MYPLDFEEFIMCMGINENVVTSLRDTWEQRIPVDDFVHAKLMELFRLYLIVGNKSSVNYETIVINFRTTISALPSGQH